MHTGIFVQSCGHPSLIGTLCYIGIGPKLSTNCNFKHVIFVYTGEFGPKFSEGLPGVLGNKGTLAKYRREQRNISQFLGTREQNSKNYSTKKF